MTERQKILAIRKDGIVEQRKMPQNSKRQNPWMAEWWKIPRNPKRLNYGKSLKILKD